MADMDVTDPEEQLLTENIRTRLSSKTVQAAMCLKSWNPILAELNDESVVVE